MGDDTKIQWTNATWNPIRGCSRVSEGCRNCYAEGVAARFSGTVMKDGKEVRLPYFGLARRAANGEPRWTGEVRMVPEHLSDPLRWTRPRRIFVNSMSDLFHEKLTDEQIASVFGVMAAAPRHTFQILTKRAKRMREWFDWLERAADHISNVFPDDSHEWRRVHLLRAAALRAGAGAGRGHSLPGYTEMLEPGWPLKNVWLGVSAEDQDAWNERVPELKECPAVVRWVSVEPQLELIVAGKKDLGQGSDCPECGWMVRVDEDGCCSACGEDAMWYGIDWLVQGGESGRRARPFDIAWVRSLQEQCGKAGVPYFLKQLGARPIDSSLCDVWANGEHRYTRRPGDPIIEEARKTPGYDVRPHDLARLLRDGQGGDPSEWPDDLRDSRAWPVTA